MRARNVPVCVVAAVSMYMCLLLIVYPLHSHWPAPEQLAALRRDCAALRASNHEKDDAIRTNDDDLRLLMDFAIMSWGRERLVAALRTFKNEHKRQRSQKP